MKVKILPGLRKYLCVSGKNIPLQPIFEQIEYEKRNSPRELQIGCI